MYFQDWQCQDRLQDELSVCLGLGSSKVSAWSRIECKYNGNSLFLEKSEETWNTKTLHLWVVLSLIGSVHPHPHIYIRFHTVSITWCDDVSRCVNFFFSTHSNSFCNVSTTTVVAAKLIYYLMTVLSVATTRYTLPAKTKSSLFIHKSSSKKQNWLNYDGKERRSKKKRTSRPIVPIVAARLPCLDLRLSARQTSAAATQAQVLLLFHQAAHFHSHFHVHLWHSPLLLLEQSQYWKRHWVKLTQFSRRPVAVNDPPSILSL